MVKQGTRARRRRWLSGFGLICLAAAMATVQAGVNAKNGNFYISYIDISISGPVELEVTRTYNSKAGDTGLFGTGWGSDYETVLRVLGDGRIEIQENGTGSRVEFYPPIVTVQERIASVDAILSAMERDEGFGSEQARIEQREQLLSDATLRSRSWLKYVSRGLLPPREIPPGSLFRSLEFGEQYVLRTHDGYRRVRGQSVDVFDSEGRLIQMDRPGGYSVNLIRDHEGRLTSITDSLGNLLTIHMNRHGRIVRIDGPGEIRSEYFYDGNRLVRNRDAGGNVYVYRYDANANMIAVGYEDGSRHITTYAGTEFDGTQYTRSVGKSQSDTTWYRYGDYYKRPDGQAYFTEIVQESPSGDVHTRLREYWIASTSDGTRYTQRFRETVDGRVFDKIFDHNGRAIRIEHDGRVARFEYDERGRVTLRDDGQETTELTYDEHVGKVATVIQYRNEDPDRRLTAEYQYDALGNLTMARDSEGREFMLEYRDDKIIRASSRDTRLAFEYGDWGKPVRIELEGTGVLVVTYDDTGEIASVDTEGDGGHLLALEVTQAFQTLLTLVKPADVDLNL